MDTFHCLWLLSIRTQSGKQNHLSYGAKDVLQQSALPQPWEELVW